VKVYVLVLGQGKFHFLNFLMHKYICEGFVMQLRGCIIRNLLKCLQNFSFECEVNVNGFHVIRKCQQAYQF